MKAFIDKFLLKEWALVVVTLFLFIAVKAIFEDQHGLMQIAVVVLAFAKVSYFLFFTFRSIENPLTFKRRYYQIAAYLGGFILLIILSFALDYTCLLDCDKLAFKGLTGEGIIGNFFQMTYFSTVTFATVGFGDMAPLSYPAKVLVMTEIASSFFMVVFIVSNFLNIKRGPENGNAQ